MCSITTTQDTTSLLSSMPHRYKPTGHVKDEIQKNGRLYRELRSRVREDAARCLQRAVRSYLLNDDSSQKNDVVVKTWANVQELAQMSVKQLRREKRVVKRDLKDFDCEFFEKHGRKPNKKDKEPIRWQYERYNDLKLLIEGLEQAGNDERTQKTTRLRLEKRILQRSLRRYEEISNTSKDERSSTDAYVHQVSTYQQRVEGIVSHLNESSLVK